MKLEGVVLLSGYTARAKAYVQALQCAGLVPEMTVLYGDRTSVRPGQGGVMMASRPGIGTVYLPNLAEPLDVSIHRGDWPSVSVTDSSVNSAAVVARLREIAPRYVIFSGYGGEIVRSDALGVAPFLHVHAGWLPDFRGSTTGYYSWLEEGRLGTSAIILNPEIDMGVVVMRSHYDLPPAGVDMDYLWDPAIRADLLVRLMKHLAKHGALPAPEPQQVEEGRSFYVIHPLLKHVARLSSWPVDADTNPRDQ